jgi:hypothetical protein
MMRWPKSKGGEAEAQDAEKANRNETMKKKAKRLFEKSWLKITTIYISIQSSKLKARIPI